MAIESSLTPSRQAIEAQVAKILASPVFSKSGRMSGFLRFIVGKTLDGQNDDLKEYTIALEVFDKDESFDPRIDPTVRSEARRLRAKLSEYYQTASGDDMLLVDLPKGSYVPVFRERQSAGPARQRTRPRLYVALALVAAIAIAAGIWWWSAWRRHANPTSRSIAVLPFENLSADPANEYFSDGLTEEILNALANVDGFKVVARTSAFQFKGKHQDIRSIGKQLNVDMVLDGAGLRPRFRVVVDGQQVERPKPFPDVYLRAANLLGVNPGKCIVFEDSPTGVEAGRSAGMRVVGVQTHSADLRDVDLSIRDFDDPKLEQWLSSLQV